MIYIDTIGKYVFRATINCFLLFFQEPLKLYGEGEYNLNAVKVMPKGSEIVHSSLLLF